VNRGVDSIPVAERFFIPREVAWLEDGPEAELSTRFTQLWTLKEAYAKALGVGIADVISNAWFEVGSTLAVRGTGDPCRFQFALFSPVPGYVAAVAAQPRSLGPLAIACLAATDGPGPKVRLTRNTTFVGRGAVSGCRCRASARRAHRDEDTSSGTEDD